MKKILTTCLSLLLTWQLSACSQTTSALHNGNPKNYAPQQMQTVAPAAPALQTEIQLATQYINQLRAEKGLAPLSPDTQLSAYAQRRAEELSIKFSHTRPNGQLYHHEIAHAASAENIAAGSATAAETVLGQWKNSAGHYANIMGNFQKIGIGLVYAPNSTYRYYWALIVGDNHASAPYIFQ